MEGSESRLLSYTLVVPQVTFLYALFPSANFLLVVTKPASLQHVYFDANSTPPYSKSPQTSPFNVVLVIFTTLCKLAATNNWTKIALYEFKN